MVVDDLIADGADIVVRWHATNTHAGEGLGLEPTQLPVNVHEMIWHRCKDGRMVAAWDGWNQEALV